MVEPTTATKMPLTPIECRSGYFFKRDDLFEIAGVKGGKARTCWHLAQNARGLVTASSRESPQAKIVTYIAKHLGIPCWLHMPWGKITESMQQLIDLGATITQQKPGFSNVMISHAKKRAQESGVTYIPFGMECQEAVKQTSAQVANLPKDIKRIVVPVGSGMSLAGITHGLVREGIRVPILGIQVGASPLERLERYAHPNWKQTYSLVSADGEYHKPAPDTEFCGVGLDPYYEAKCIPFLQEGDLLWVVGRR